MPLTIEQVNAQAAQIDARMRLPSSDPNYLSLDAGRAALFDLADQLDVTVPAGATAVFYSGDFRDLGGGSSVHSGAIAAELVERANDAPPPTTRFVTLNDTALGQVLGDETSAFRIALGTATGGNPTNLRFALQGSVSGEGVADSLFGRGSARFAASATGATFG